MAPRALGFDAVRKMALALEGVEEATAYGSPCLKVGGHMFACMAINKSVEPQSLMIRVPIDQRDELVAEQPDIFYLTPHYAPYPCVLIRLSRVHPDALRDLLRGSWQEAARRPRKRTPAARTATKRPGAAKRSRVSR
jgi:hypothetical protein